MDDLRAALTMVSATFRSKLKHPFTFTLNTAVNTLDVITPVLAIAALTHTFGTLGGWTFPQLLLLLGATNTALGFSLLFAGAFDSFLFTAIFRSGQFESALLRPGNTALFLAASNIRPYRSGRVLAALVVTTAGVITTGTQPALMVLVLVLAIAVGSAVMSSLWFFDAASLVRFGQANDFTRSLPFVAAEMSFYPQNLYPVTGQVISQLVLGLGAAIYLPIAWVLGKDPNFGVWSLLAGPAILPFIMLTARTAWTRAVASYVRAGGR